MARLPNSRKEETHDRILAVAARALRRQGYAGVGVADVMREAGLTHGGFYAHFANREALIVEALERAARDSGAVVAEAVRACSAHGLSSFRALVESYLSDQHLAALDAGCPVAALAADMPRQPESVRAASSDRVRQLIDTVRSTLTPTLQPQAFAVASTLVGALQLARALGDNPEGRAALTAARQSLLESFDSASPSR